MIYKVRRGVFETNSSSTHSLTMCSKEDFEKWEAGKLLFKQYEEIFVPFNGEYFKEKIQKCIDSGNCSAAEEIVLKMALKYIENDEEIPDDIMEATASLVYNNDGEEVTYDEYFYRTDLEYYICNLKTPKGEDVVVFGLYGYNG